MGTIVWYNSGNKKNVCIASDGPCSGRRYGKMTEGDFVMSNKGVILLDKHRQLYEMMSSEDVKSLIVASLRYNEGMEVGELTYGAKIASVFMFEQIDHFNESYDRRCKSNAEIARRREAQRTEAAYDDETYAELLTEDADQPAETEPVEKPAPKRKTAVRKPKIQNTQNTTEHEQITNEHEDTTNAHQPTTNANHSNSNPNSNSNPDFNSISISPSSSSSANLYDDECVRENTDSCNDRETDGAAQREEYSCSHTSSDEKMKDDGNDEKEREKENKNEDRNKEKNEEKNEDGTAAACGSIGFESVTVPKVGEIPTLAQVREHCRLYAPNVNADDFYNYYSSRDWKVAGMPVMSWRGIVRSWQQRGELCAANTAQTAKAEVPQKDAAAVSPPSGESNASYDVDTFIRAAMRRSFEDID